MSAWMFLFFSLQVWFQADLGGGGFEVFWFFYPFLLLAVFSDIQLLLMCLLTGLKHHFLIYPANFFVCLRFIKSAELCFSTEVANPGKTCRGNNRWKWLFMVLWQTDVMGPLKWFFPFCREEVAPAVLFCPAPLFMCLGFVESAELCFLTEVADPDKICWGNLWERLLQRQTHVTSLFKYPFHIPVVMRILFWLLVSLLFCSTDLFMFLGFVEFAKSCPDTIVTDPCITWSSYMWERSILCHSTLKTVLPNAFFLCLICGHFWQKGDFRMK